MKRNRISTEYIFQTKLGNFYKGNFPRYFSDADHEGRLNY